MKPYDIFKKRIIPTNYKSTWNRIRYKECVVVLFHGKQDYCLVKDEEKYLFIYKTLGDRYILFVEDLDGVVVGIFQEEMRNKNKIKFKDEILYKEFREYLVAESI